MELKTPRLQGLNSTTIIVVLNVPCKLPFPEIIFKILPLVRIQRLAWVE